MTDRTLLSIFSIIGHGVMIVWLMERAGLTIDKHPYLRMGVCATHAILMAIIGYFAVLA